MLIVLVDNNEKIISTKTSNTVTRNTLCFTLSQYQLNLLVSSVMIKHKNNSVVINIKTRANFSLKDPCKITTTWILVNFQISQFSKVNQCKYEKTRSEQPKKLAANNDQKHKKTVTMLPLDCC